VTNNSFVHQTACDGLQKYLAREFSEVYHLDLRGNVRQNPTLSGTAYNVFGIQVGVGITIAVRRKQSRKRTVKYHPVPLTWARPEKLRWLAKTSKASDVPWESMRPDDKGTWMIVDGRDEFEKYPCLGTKDAKASHRSDLTGVLFKSYSLGISTNRDGVTYNFGADALNEAVRDFADRYNGEVDRFKRAGNIKNLDAFLNYDRIKWSRNLKNALKGFRYIKFSKKLVRTSLYRPFTKERVYLAEIVLDEEGLVRRFFPNEDSTNAVICVPSIGNRAIWTTLVADTPVNLNLTSVDGYQYFPFYVYGEDGSNRRENITNWALDQFRLHYKNKKISKWDIFHYVYALLHHPGYREKFAGILKRELPRIPFAPDFAAFAKAGKKLADLHVNYESTKEFPLKEIITPRTPRSPRVESKMKLSKDKTALIVNDSITLTGIPAEAFAYKLGNRSALEWVIDQYQVYTDKRTGITSDPNAWGEEHGNPEYIIELVARVITVSLETLKIVQGLPKEYAN
jgi:predicted helicase